MTTDINHLPAEVRDLITPEDIPESYTDIKNELQWYAELLHTRDAISFVDVADCMAGVNRDNESEPWDFDDIYQRFADNLDGMRERFEGDDPWDTIVRVLHLLVALEPREEARYHMRKYAGNEPGTSGTIYDIGKVQARMNARVYRLTDKSVAVFTNDLSYGAFVAVGNGRYNASFPRDVAEWFDNHYGDYMTADEVKEHKRRAEQASDECEA